MLSPDHKHEVQELRADGADEAFGVGVGLGSPDGRSMKTFSRDPSQLHVNNVIGERASDLLWVPGPLSCGRSQRVPIPQASAFEIIPLSKEHAGLLDE